MYLNDEILMQAVKEYTDLVMRQGNMINNLIEKYQILLKQIEDSNKNNFELVRQVDKLILMLIKLEKKN